jgi:uncharacterized membrane protein YbhN (UPF0104 family)
MIPVSAESKPTGWRHLVQRLIHLPIPAIFGLCLVLAIVVLWWQGALGELWDVVRDASLALTLAGFALFVVGLALLCFRWHALVKMANGGQSDLPRASEAFLTSVVINYAAPVGLAVPSRAALTKRTLGLDASATGTIALWEIAADVFVLGVGSVLWLLFAKGSWSAVTDELGDSALQFGLFAVVIVLMGVVAGVILLRKPSLRGKVGGMLRQIALAPKARPRAAAEVLGVTIVYWILQAITLGVFVRAMHVDVNFEFLHGITTIPFLVGILSPIPGGAVVRESLMYVVARLSDLPGGEVVAAAVLYRMALFASIPILFVITRFWIRFRADPIMTPVK